MALENNIGRNTPPESPSPDASQQLDLAVPSLEAALQATPEERIDRHLGRGVGFTLQRAQVELFSQVVRVTVPKGQLVVPRREAEVFPEGVVFQDADSFLLSVSPDGAVLFQYDPPKRDGKQETLAPREAVPGTPPRLEPAPPEPSDIPQVPPSPSPDESQEKAKSERYVGRLGEVRMHETKAGKLVAEVELTVPDPDKPGASRLVKFAAFGDKAKALQQNYRPGQEVTAVGIPHELIRKTRDGKEYRERQIYFVNLPKPR